MEAAAEAEIKAPRRADAGPWGWARVNLFSGIGSSIMTVIFFFAAFILLPPLVEWAIIKATWSAPDIRECRANGGACWAFIAEKHRLMLFGLYPYAEQWRPMIVVVLFIILIGLSCSRRFWNLSLIPIWLVGVVSISILMWGGIFGLTFVENEKWGGLPLTLILAVFGMVFAFPLAIVLALGRRSRLPAIRMLCVGYIELIRGVPLISLLFMASVMFPLFLPEGANIDKLLRAQIAIIMFAAAYLAEVIRGGLQSLPKGQFEGADSLGLSYWQKTGFIVLPQALRIVIPPLVNTLIGMFKDTSLVVIIGLFDLMNATKASFVDPLWRGASIEAYLFVSLIYFAFCYFMSKYSQNIESRLSQSNKR